MVTATLNAALAWLDARAAVLPTRSDGSKAPMVAWKPYTTTAPTREQVQTWFAGGHPGLGLVTGAVSGGLEMAEFEARAMTEGLFVAVTQLATASGLGELWQRVTQGGYMEWTPSGGLHLLYRVNGTPVPGNTKLARRPATAEELVANPTDKIKVLIETRGEGGFVVVAPSYGPTHPTGRPWTTAYGGPATVPTITAEEHKELHRLMRCHDQMPVTASTPAPPPRTSSEGLSPGDDYDNRVDWVDILVPHGWELVSTHGGTRYWRRPGKSHGTSASTGRADDRDRLWVWSSSTEFATETPYTKFGAYALLEHGGDYSAAAGRLRRDGYGGALPPSAAEEQAAAIAELAPGVVAQPASAPVTTEPAGAVAKVTSTEPDGYGPTEDGLARLLVAQHGHELRFCPQRGQWLRWNGFRWAWDDTGHHRELIKALARQVPETDRTWRKFHDRVMSAQGVTGVERHARTDPTMVVGFDDLDADGWELNTPDGILDLRTGMLRAPDPTALCTRSTTVTLDPEVSPATWERFLQVTFGGDQQLINYLQRLVGHSAVGVIGPHILPFAHGSGGNGKGVFLEALTGVLGDYATASPVGFLMASPYPRHETEIARLAGARMVICSEVNENDRFDEAKVQQLTGGDTLTAHFMRQDHFSFSPTHHLWLMGNHKPAVRSGGRAFWRRLRLIPFDHEVPEDDVIEDLQGTLIREHGPALLAWIVAGAVAYAKGGLREHAAVRAATAEYAGEQDTATQFIEERCLKGGGEHVKIRTSVVREAYERWCSADRLTPANPTAFGLALRRAGVDVWRSNGVKFYVGLALVRDEDERGNRDDR